MIPVILKRSDSITVKWAKQSNVSLLQIGIITKKMCVINSDQREIMTPDG